GCTSRIPSTAAIVSSTTSSGSARRPTRSPASGIPPTPKASEMNAELVFYVLAACAVGSALLCIVQRNPVASALWLVSTMFALAAIYVLLNAQFIAAIQVLVYAGAVMVLFLFVIMLLNLGHAEPDMRGPSTVAATLVIVGLLAIELFALLQ